MFFLNINKIKYFRKKQKYKSQLKYNKPKLIYIIYLFIYFI